MKTIAVILALALLASPFFLFSQKVPKTGIDPVSCMKLIEAWTAMWNSYDLNQVDKLFLTDGRVTYFSSETPGRIAGIEALRQHHASLGFVPGGAAKKSRLWLEEGRYQVYGMAVVVTAIWVFQREGVSAEKAQRGTMTLVCMKEGNEYRIAHAHFANWK